MTPTEITLSVVHSTGLYETVRLECKYTLETDDDLTASFVKARAELDNAFLVAYPEHKPEKTLPELDNAFFVAYPEHKPKKTLQELTVNSNEFDRVCRALKDGKTDISELQKYFKINADAMDYFIKYKLV